jgi:hypothetical protein
MLKEAQAIVQDCDLVFPEHLNEWASDSAFKAESLTSVRIRINGNVEGGRQKTRSEQEALLEKRGLAMASVEDLAVAFAAHYIATKEPLFGWFDAATSAVRATEQHVLRFDDEGLYMSVVVNADRNRHMAVAARLE